LTSLEVTINLCRIYCGVVSSSRLVSLIFRFDSAVDREQLEQKVTQTFGETSNKSATFLMFVAVLFTFIEQSLSVDAKYVSRLPHNAL
jgi:hypothetical protein